MNPRSCFDRKGRGLITVIHESPSIRVRVFPSIYAASVSRRYRELRLPAGRPPERTGQGTPLGEIRSPEVNWDCRDHRGTRTSFSAGSDSAPRPHQGLPIKTAIDAGERLDSGGADPPGDGVEELAGPDVGRRGIGDEANDVGAGAFHIERLDPVGKAAS